MEAPNPAERRYLVRARNGLGGEVTLTCGSDMTTSEKSMNENDRFTEIIKRYESRERGDGSSTNLYLVFLPIVIFIKVLILCT